MALFVIYLLIPLSDVSQRTVRVAAGIIGGVAGEQPSSLLHAIAIRPIWPRGDASVCSLGEVCSSGCASRKTFHSLS